MDTDCALEVQGLVACLAIHPLGMCSEYVASR